MKYRVHLYRVVRLAYEVEAENQQSAISEAEKAFDPYDLRNAEDAEECVGYLVDEEGDEEYNRTVLYSENREAVQ